MSSAAMTAIPAVFQNGVFRPLQEVPLAENQRVSLSVEPLTTAEPENWLAEARELRQRILAARGCMPDSALDIAEDRQR